MRILADFNPLMRENTWIPIRSYLSLFVFETLTPARNSYSTILTELANANYTLRESVLRSYDNISKSINQLNKDYQYDDGRNVVLKNKKENIINSAYVFLLMFNNVFDIIVNIIYVLEFKGLYIKNEKEIFLSFGQYERKSKSENFNGFFNTLKTLPQKKILTNFRDKITHRGFTINIESHGQTNGFEFILERVETVAMECDIDSAVNFKNPDMLGLVYPHISFSDCEVIDLEDLMSFYFELEIIEKEFTDRLYQDNNFLSTLLGEYSFNLNKPIFKKFIIPS